jgi:hypothetical protein
MADFGVDLHFFSFLTLTTARLAHRGNSSVLLAGDLGLFLEAMQNVNGFFELGDVHDTVDAAHVPNANFSYPSTRIVERFPVGRLKSGLDLP